jgi:hypothetical protein
MPKIVLDVQNEHLNTVMTILKNLNPKLINQLEVDSKTIEPVSSSIQKRYEPKNKPSPTSPTGRYLSPEAYKAKLARKK